MDRVSLRMVREKVDGYDAGTKVNGPADAYRVMKDLIGDLPYESVQAVFTDNRNNVVGVTEIGRGSPTGSVASPRQLVVSALMCNATNVVLAHNHPSGEVTPSLTDEKMTKKMAEACKTVELNLVDHLILPSCGPDGVYTSIRNESPGLFEF